MIWQYHHAKLMLVSSQMKVALSVHKANSYLRVIYPTKECMKDYTVHCNSCWHKISKFPLKLVNAFFGLQ